MSVENKEQKIQVLNNGSVLTEDELQDEVELEGYEEDD